MADNNSNDPLKKELTKTDTTAGIYGDTTGRALGGKKKALGKKYKADDGTDQYWTGGGIGLGQRIDPRTNWLHQGPKQPPEPTAEQRGAALEERGKKEAAQNEADIAGYDPDFLASVAEKLGMSQAGAVGFLKRMGKMPTQVQVPSVAAGSTVPGTGPQLASTVPGTGPQYQAAYQNAMTQLQDDVDSGEITQDEANTRAVRLANAEINPRPATDTQINTQPSTTSTGVTGAPLQGAGEAGSFSLENFLSNIFGPGARDASSVGIGTGPSGTGTNVGFLKSDQPALGLAGLQQAAPDPRLEGLMKMFGDDMTAERKKELEDIFTMIEGFSSSMVPQRVGPQTQAYRFGGGF